MSYYVQISFYPNVKEKEVFQKARLIHQHALISLKEVVKENAEFCPTSPLAQDFFDWDEYRQFKREHAQLVSFAEIEWIRSLATSKFIYWPEYELLGVLGEGNNRGTTVSFQNSTNQDYNIQTWQGIPLFEKVCKNVLSSNSEPTTGQKRAIYKKIEKCLDIELFLSDPRLFSWAHPVFVEDTINALTLNKLHVDLHECFKKSLSEND